MEAKIMKKILLTALALVCVALLAAGCNNQTPPDKVVEMSMVVDGFMAIKIPTVYYVWIL